MTIQVITYSGKIKHSTDSVTFSSISAPFAFDDFDVNVVDLNDRNLWSFKRSEVGKTDFINDFCTLQRMAVNRKKSTIIYVLPQNLTYSCDTFYAASSNHYPMKDVIDSVHEKALKKLIFPKNRLPTIYYERTKTAIAGKIYSADFHFGSYDDILTKSEKSEKPTTIRLTDGIYATTLDVTKNINDTTTFVGSLFIENNSADIPVWLENITFSDDELQKNTIAECEEKILFLTEKIDESKCKLCENLRYKSVLYTSGEELVSVVFEMLEKLLSCDLSTFKDVRKEDFLIQLETCTFIGEIKGVSSNVRFEHISQIELHYRSYLDKLVEENKNEKVKQLLIINPFRNKPLEDRTEIHADQISLAERNNCLIIETNTLLRVFEKFLEDQISSQQCKAVFENKNGILTLLDFENGN